MSQTDTYLSAGRKQLSDRMRKTDEARARCKRVVIESPIAPRPLYNGEIERVEKSLVN